MAAVAGILFTDAVGLPAWWSDAQTATYALDTKTQLAVGVPLFAVLEGMRARGWERTGESGAFGMHPFDPLGKLSPEMRLKEVKNARLAMVAFLGFASQAAVRGLGPIECLKVRGEGFRVLINLLFSVFRARHKFASALVSALALARRQCAQCLNKLTNAPLTSPSPPPTHPPAQLHLEDPGHNNIFTSAVGHEATLAVVVLSLLPVLLEAKRSLDGGDDEEFRPIPW